MSRSGVGVKPTTRIQGLQEQPLGGAVFAGTRHDRLGRATTSNADSKPAKILADSGQQHGAVSGCGRCDASAARTGGRGLRAGRLQLPTLPDVTADTTTARVRRPDSERLHSLARARQSAVVDVVHAAIDALERQEFLRGLNGDYQRLRNDPARREQYLAERHEWDALA